MLAIFALLVWLVLWFGAALASAPLSRRAGAIVLLLLLCSPPASARDLDGRYAKAPPEIKEWFKAQHANGLPCCDIADGHETISEKRADGRYWVPLEGKWWPVPNEVVIKDTGNPIGRAIVWYIVNIETKQVFIRCFVPQAET